MMPAICKATRYHIACATQKQPSAEVNNVKRIHVGPAPSHARANGAAQSNPGSGSRKSSRRAGYGYHMAWGVTKGILIAFAILATIWSVIGFIRVRHERKQRTRVERRKARAT
jgi:hypothetical protein